MNKRYGATSARSKKSSFRLSKKNRKRTIRYSLLSVNAAFLIAAVGFVAQAPSSTPMKQSALSASDTVALASPLDQVSSADIAVQVAQMVNLDQRQSVINNADSVNAQLTSSPSDDKFIAKPQVVATESKSYKDIAQYVVVDGDTVASIAEKFSVTSDSIRGTNNLYGNTVRVGSELTIPPVDGIVYTVKTGETPEMIAQRFQANQQALIAFNDAEVRGFSEGQKIMIPGGVQQIARATTSNPIALGGFAWGGYAPVYGGNGYDRGYCTWWAAARRAQSGRPIPNNLGNAVTWRALAQRAGLAVGNTPAQGAVIWHPPQLSATYLGHVAFVEELYPDGSIRVSDMNARGWGVVTERTLSAAEAAAYSYIY